ncbi:MAG: hypothetical protein ACRBBK_02750 [Paracoccaceae bacterium]
MAKLFNTLRNSRFFSDQSGAVTVDWIVLTAAVVGLGISVIMTASGGTTGLAQTIDDGIVAVQVTTN